MPGLGRELLGVPARPRARPGAAAAVSGDPAASRGGTPRREHRSRAGMREARCGDGPTPGVVVPPSTCAPSHHRLRLPGLIEKLPEVFCHACGHVTEW